MSNFFYDPLVADALVQRYPVPGASTADKAAAAKKLWDRGLQAEQIAVHLKVSSRQVTRFINDMDVMPLPPIPEWASRDDWPRCKNGHELTPDNVRNVKVRNRTYERCRQCGCNTTHS